MRAWRRGDNLWLWLWHRDKFWHQLPKMRRTDDDVISLHAIRLATEALSGLLRTARHLCWILAPKAEALSILLSKIIKLWALLSIFIAMKKGSFLSSCFLSLFLHYLTNLAAVRKLSISLIFSSRQYIPSWISYKREQPSAVPPSLVKSSK